MTDSTDPTSQRGGAEAVEDSAWDTAVSGVRREHFRPDIEGLRALAVLAVLAYHARIPKLHGGFVGVDVFFVISGFLITGLLLRELAARGGIDLRHFYARRARRLLPAALVVIAVTVFAAWLILSPVDVPDVGGDGAAAALYVSNYRFALVATDYFAAGGTPSPLLHYWSLGVEEQFYLFWPLLLLAAASLWSVRRLWVPMGAVAIGSFLLSMVLTGVNPPWAFYSLPTRAWELALGGLIAIGAIRVPSGWPRSAVLAACASGLALILAATLLFNRATHFPGMAALMPALGTALVIMAGERGQTLPSRLLAHGVPRWFGRISYSLYLWHWPILILGPIVLGTSSLLARVGLAALSVVVAALSTRFIETPIRTGWPAAASSGRTLAVSGGASVAVAAVALLIGGAVFAGPTAGAPLPTLAPEGGTAPALPAAVLSGTLPADLQPTLLQARNDRGPLGPDDCETLITDAELKACAYGDLTSSTTVVVFGDSHAAMWFPAILAIAEERHWRVVPLVKPACPPVRLTVWRSSLSRALTECDTWRDRALSRIASERPSITFVVTSRNYRLVDASGNEVRGFPAVSWEAALTDVLRELKAVSGLVVLIGETPHIADDPVECLATHELIEDCPSPRRKDVAVKYDALQQRSAQAAGVAIVPTVDWLCTEGSCPLVMDHYLVYRNSGHLTATITTVLAPQLRWALDHLP